MEHLSNSLQQAKASPAAQYMGQLRNSINMTASGSPGSSQPGYMSTDNSRARLQTQLAPEVEYDPWQANQQRFLAAQGAALNK